MVVPPAVSMGEPMMVSAPTISLIFSSDTLMISLILLSAMVNLRAVKIFSDGFASGGLDYDADKQDKDKKPSLLASASFSGGGGTGISVSPIGFLVVGKDGRVELLTVDNPNAGDTVDKLVSVIERSPEIIARVKSAFTKKGEDEE